MRSEAENPGEGQKPEAKAGKRPALSWGKDISELMKTAHFPDLLVLFLKAYLTV